MKCTGIVRRIDDLGRVVIPKEVRRFMRIREGDQLELFTEKDSLILRKYSAVGENAIAESACSALKSHGFLFAIYDTTCVVKSNREKEFLFYTPDNWMYQRDVFSDDRMTVFPLIVLGEIVGFVCVKDVGDGVDFVKGVIATVVADMGRTEF